MSRNISKRKLAAVGVLLLSIALLFSHLWYVGILLLLMISLAVINYLVRRQMSAPIYAGRAIRSYDTLLIGDRCCTKILQNHITPATLELTSSGRSLEASYQILLHTSSILDEGGTCVIVGNGKSTNNSISLFDVGFLSLTTKKELGVETLMEKLRFPLLYSPVCSLKNLLKISSAYTEGICPHQGIVDFCKRKNITLKYLKK